MEEKRPRGRPPGSGKGVTPKRDVRVGPIWDEAHALAMARGESMREVLERALKHYVHRYRVRQTAEADQENPVPHSPA